MSKKLSLVVVCGIAIGAVAWVAPMPRVWGTTTEPADRVVEQPKVETVKWESAELRMSAHPFWNVATTGENQPAVEIVLSLADKTHKTETFAGLADPLGRKPSQETATAVLNMLGQEGWEPVGYAATEWVNPGRAIKRVEVWSLKRPGKK